MAWFLLFWLVQDCEGKQAIVQDLLSSEQSFNTANHRYSSVDGYVTVCSICTERNAPAHMCRLRLRRHSRPCAYYANSSVAFHLRLVGDLTFQLNPGPVGRRITTLVPTIAPHNVPRCIRDPSNLINVLWLPMNNPTHCSLSLCLVNSQSGRNKTADFVDYIFDHRCDLIAVTETWLRTIDDAIRAELCPAGYKPIDYARTGRGGGGIGLLYKDSLQVTKVRNGEEESFEYCELLVQISSLRKIRVVIVFRPPFSENHRVPMGIFLREFSSYMESIILSNDHLLILGDFNIHMDVSTDADTAKFVDLLESLGLEQHVSGPTHTDGHTLDLVITRKMENIIACPPCICHYFSDHAAVHCDININKPAFRAKKISYRKVKAVDMDCLKRDLALTDLYKSGQHTPLSASDLDMLVCDYNVSLSSIMDRHAPLKTKSVRARPQVPWYNADTAEAKRRRRKAERRWRKTRLPEDLDTFKRLKNHSPTSAPRHAGISTWIS